MALSTDRKLLHQQLKLANFTTAAGTTTGIGSNREEHGYDNEAHDPQPLGNFSRERASPRTERVKRVNFRMTQRHSGHIV